VAAATRAIIFSARPGDPADRRQQAPFGGVRQRRAEREAHEFNTMSELAKGLSKMVLVLTVKTGDEGALRNRDVGRDCR
jgi:hypothetical protein